MAKYFGRSQAFVAFQVRLTPDMKERLQQRSYETGMSQVAIINAALEFYLAHVPSTAKEETHDPADAPGRNHDNGTA